MSYDLEMHAQDALDGLQALLTCLGAPQANFGVRSPEPRPGLTCRRGANLAELYRLVSESDVRYVETLDSLKLMAKRTDILEGCRFRTLAQDQLPAGAWKYFMDSRSAESIFVNARCPPW